MFDLQGHCQVLAAVAPQAVVVMWALKLRGTFPASGFAVLGIVVEPSNLYPMAGGLVTL